MDKSGWTPLKIQNVGHSFVTKLKDFIRSTDDVNFFLYLSASDYLIQFSGFPGATVDTLRNKLDVVEDFQPDVVFLLVGTNDLYNNSVDSIAQKIVDMTDTLHKICVCGTNNISSTITSGHSLPGCRSKVQRESGLSE